MSVNEAAFLERYSKLNQQQQEAVNAIYGPVMVIAGPGTGKTEVLSMRIANLLRSEAQVQPNEILCLTYTDEATNAMRRRLLQIIGPDAHRVNIGTFHAFCNNVIQNNSDAFSDRPLQPVSDLERTTLLREMLDELPKGHELRRLSGDIYYDVFRLDRLFDMMKRENISAQNISDAVDEYLTSLPEREEYIYKRAGKGYAKGDLKQAAIDDETRKMNTTRAAALLFDTYTAKMRKRGWYDFNDMILWVLQAFKKKTGYVLDDFRPVEHSQADSIPTMVAQVKADFSMPFHYVEEIYNNISAKDKKLFWIEGTDQRFQGYNYFGQNPKVMLEWFDKHFK